MKTKLSQIASNIERLSIPVTGRMGIEKESLRMNDTKISSEPHFDSLGSALCNKFITNDFSESQIEMITKPEEEVMNLKRSLKSLHHFIYQKIEKEYLWPLSMPPSIENVSQIPIAQFGKSNLGKFKYIYRKGLSERYGRLMQAISGIHFNYSLSDALIEENVHSIKERSAEKRRSIVYFNGLRNLYRYNWLIILLFGSSPIISKQFLTKKLNFKKLSQDTYYLPYATSLRMSDIGYQNKSQSSIYVSLNSLDEYTEQLFSLISTLSDDYVEISYKEKEMQLNNSILQIEDELYSPARPKSTNPDYLRPTSKLKKFGVDYLELRSIDLNPFSKIGISYEELYFLEVFLSYCLLKESPPMTNTEHAIIKKNNQLVSTDGRNTSLKIENSDKEMVSIKDEALNLINELEPIASLMTNHHNIHIDSLSLFRERIKIKDQHPSEQLISQIADEKVSHDEFGFQVGKKHKEHFLKKDKKENTDWSMLQKEASDSIIRQRAIESKDDESWESFLSGYYK
tara:strand:- start:23 stop:1561 length:1539 start_codon:yes stop_codon:yes gene_type:complete